MKINERSCGSENKKDLGRGYLPGGNNELELELELIQSHMTQKPMLRGEVDARVLRV